MFLLFSRRLFYISRCRTPLTRLAARLEANEQIVISPQGLNKKFNKEAVNFMKNIFVEMLNCQNNILRNNESLLKMKFNRITINTNLYRGNEITEYGFKGEPKIRKRYSYLNIQELAEPLDEGETLELDDIYIGNTLKNRTKTRLFLTKLTAECKRKKEIHTKNTNLQ